MDHTNHLIHYGKAIKAILMATVQDPSKQSGIRGTPASKSLWTAAFQHQLLDSSCIEPSSEKAMAKSCSGKMHFSTTLMDSSSANHSSQSSDPPVRAFSCGVSLHYSLTKELYRWENFSRENARWR